MGHRDLPLPVPAHSRDYRDDRQTVQGASVRKGHNEQEIDALAPIHDNQIHMALLAIYACNSINGVAKIHSEILKHEVFNRSTVGAR